MRLGDTWGMKRVRPIPKLPRRQRLFLREWRTYRGLTQERLAERAGLTQGLISQLERNASDYTGETLAALANALGCEPVDLLIRNPMDVTAPWSIWETVRDMQPTEQVQALEVVKTLRRVNTRD